MTDNKIVEYIVTHINDISKITIYVYYGDENIEINETPVNNYDDALSLYYGVKNQIFDEWFANENNDIYYDVLPMYMENINGNMAINVEIVVVD